MGKTWIALATALVVGISWIMVGCTEKGAGESGPGEATDGGEGVDAGEAGSCATGLVKYLDDCTLTKCCTQVLKCESNWDCAYCVEGHLSMESSRCIENAAVAILADCTSAACSNDKDAGSAVPHYGNWTYPKTAGASAVRRTGDDGFVLVGTIATRKNPNDSAQDDVWVGKTNGAGSLEWESTFGGGGNDEGNAVAELPSGGFVFAGAKRTADQYVNGSFWVQMIDATGKAGWSFEKGGSDLASAATAVTIAPDGGIVAAGYLGVSGNDGDVFVVKLDKSGKLVWSHNYGGNLDDRAYAIDKTADGGYVIAGHTDSLEPGKLAYAAWLLRLDGDGNRLWDKLYGEASGGACCIGDFAYSVSATSEGGFILAGTTYTKNPVPTSEKRGAFWVWKTTSDGTLLWEKIFGEDSYTGQSAMAVRPDAKGGYVAVGYKGHPNSDDLTNDAWLVKLSDKGDKVWERTYGGIGRDSATDLLVLADGDLIVAGVNGSRPATLGGAWLMRLDANGGKECAGKVQLYSECQPYGVGKEGWSFDDCDAPLSLLVTCTSKQQCKLGECKDCQAHSRKVCQISTDGSNDSWWFDSCSNKEEMAAACGAAGCVDGNCGGTGQCALTSCAAGTFTYSCGSGSSQTTNTYGGPGPGGLSQTTTTYSNGNVVTCTFSSSSSGICTDGISATCSF